MKSLDDWNLIFLFIFNILMLIFSMILLKKRTKNDQKENFFSNNENGKDFYKGNQEKYVRIPYVPYRSSKNKDYRENEGFCEIGDFLIQWGVSESNSFDFHMGFKDCFGVYIIPKGSGGGNEGVAVKEVEKDKAHVIAESAERPFYWFSFGSKKED